MHADEDAAITARRYLIVGNIGRLRHDRPRFEQDALVTNREHPCALDVTNQFPVLVSVGRKASPALRQDAGEDEISHEFVRGSVGKHQVALDIAMDKPSPTLDASASSRTRAACAWSSIFIVIAQCARA